MTQVLVPAARLARWVDNFAARHAGVTLGVAEGALTGEAPDGSRFTARLPFDRSYAGPPEPAGLAAAAAPPGEWGVLLARRGGFAVARLRGTDLVEHKVGQRHVQGRTKAGGQSQQRFARRRDNQARAAFDAAAEHAARILGGRTCPVAVGGDRAGVEAVLADARLAGLVVVRPWLAVRDPRRAVLDAAVVDAASVQVDVVNAGDPG